MMRLYAIRSSKGPVKIGFSKDPTERLKYVAALKKPNGPIGTLSLEGVYDVEDARAAEARAHRLAKGFRLAGEWFDLSEQDAADIIRRAIAGEDGEHDPKMELKVFGSTPELNERIRKFRFSNEISSEAKAIRMLVEAGLKALEKEPKP